MSLCPGAISWAVGCLQPRLFQILHPLWIRVHRRAESRCEPCNIPHRFSGIQEVVRVAYGECICARLNGRNVYEFVEDGQLELQLNAVYKTLDGLLNDMVTSELCNQQCNVESDDDDVDAEQLPHGVVASLTLGDLQNVECFPDLDSTQYDFL